MSATGRVRLAQFGPHVAVEGVRINNHGPYKFLLDTGAQTSAMSAEAARQIGLVPRFRVEQVTAAGSKLVGATHAKSVAVGGAWIDHVELMIGGIDRARTAIPGIDGVLGNNVLSRLNYLLDLANAVMIIDPPEILVYGERLEFEQSHGRIALGATVDGTRRRLVLDSGAPALILFGESSEAYGYGLISTNTGSARAALKPCKVRLGGSRRLRIPAAIVPTPSADGTGGLLPTSAFRAVYVNNAQQYVVFNPKITGP